MEDEIEEHLTNVHVSHESPCLIHGAEVSRVGWQRKTRNPDAIIQTRLGASVDHPNGPSSSPFGRAKKEVRDLMLSVGP